MFPQHPNQDDESRDSPEFTALSLRTGSLQGSPRRPTALSHIRNRENPSHSQPNLTKSKKLRGLDGTALTIGTGCSSYKVNVNNNEIDHHYHPPVLPPAAYTSRFCAAQSGIYGAESSRNKPPPVFDVSGDKEITSDHVILRGFSSENSVEKMGYGRVGGINRQSVDSDTENGSRTSAHGMAAAAVSRYDKIRNRMIKNRESAARSRARKQAQEAQQQLENAELKKENELLKKILRFLLALLRTKHMKLPALARSFSATL